MIIQFLNIIRTFVVSFSKSCITELYEFSVKISYPNIPIISLYIKELISKEFIFKVDGVHFQKNFILFVRFYCKVLHVRGFAYKSKSIYPRLFIIRAQLEKSFGKIPFQTKNFECVRFFFVFFFSV